MPSLLPAPLLLLLLLLLTASYPSPVEAASPALPLLASYFSSGMVLQRGTENPVWGWAPPSSSGVTLTVSSSTSPTPAAYNATVNATDGFWRVVLPPLDPDGVPYTFIAEAVPPAAPADAAPTTAVVAAPPSAVVVTDVLVGVVLLCSGQSNMAFNLGGVFNASEELANATHYPSIRLFSAPVTASSAPIPDFPAGTNNFTWIPASNMSRPGNDLFDFSAVCFLTGRGVSDALGPSVPVGLVEVARGGSDIQAWLSADAAAECPPAPPGWAVASLFNGMMAPLTVGPVPFSAFLWLQGEGNVADEDQSPWYACALPALVTDLRGKLASPGMTAVVVQLHPFNTTASSINATLLADPPALPHIRLVQAAAVGSGSGAAARPGEHPPTLLLSASASGARVRALANAALATAVDAGDPLAPATSLHPRNKQRPARRASAALLSLALGVPDEPYLCPRYLSASVPSSPPPPAGTLTVVVRVQAPPASLPLVWSPPTPSSNSSRCPTDRGIPAVNCGWFSLVLDDRPFPNGTSVNATTVVLDGAAGTLTLSAPAPAPCASQVGGGSGGGGSGPGCSVAGTSNGWAPWPVVNVYAADADLPLLPWLEPLTPSAEGV